MTTYADMVTNLLAFFVLLYSFSELDVLKFRQVIESFRAHTGVLESGRTLTGDHLLEEAGLMDSDDVFWNENRIADALQAFVLREGIEQSVLVVRTDEGVVLRFVDKVLFDLGKADLLPEARSILEKLVQLIAAWPNQVRVEGHADYLPINTEKYPSNWELSVYRASGVVRFLEEAGIDSKRLSAVGYGEYRPIAPNETEEGRRLNRRVDIIIVANAPQAEYTESLQ